VRRETQNILLVLLGGALLKISFTGTYLRYVKPSHQWLLITGGAIMVALALVAIVRDLANARTASAAEPAGHEHSHPARSAWLLLLPVLAVFLVAPPALGADSVQRAAGVTATAPDEGTAVFPSLPPGEVVALPLGDFTARAAWDQDRSVHNRQVRLTGFVVHDDAASYVARMAIGCCAADAFPVKVKLAGQDLSDLANDTWIEVVGTLRPGSATKENGHVPTVSVASMERIPQPEDPYEH
jgi:uncharacterized repeat protein (TIGR03943 family)